jgi:copper(I)-binding protein
MSIRRGLKNLTIDAPDDLTATNSEVSPRLPKVINAAKRMPRGNAIGTKVVDNKPRNCRMVNVSSPLPINSSIHTHMNCMIKMNQVTIKAPANGGKNARIINLSRTFKMA